MEGRVTAGRTVAPLYCAGQSKPVAILRTGRIHTEYQQHAVFRIGVLPRLVLEDVTLDMQADADVSTAMNGLRDVLSRGRPGRCPAELRKFSLRAAAEAPPMLEAGFVQLDRSEIRPSKVRLWKADGTTLTLGQARLMNGGDGRISLETPEHCYPVDWPPDGHDRPSDLNPTTPTNELP